MITIPLTPKSGGRCVSTAALALADIIVSSTNALVSKTIKAATHSSISHVMLYIGSGQVVEAIGEGVVSRSLSAALQRATVAVAYRYKNLSPSVANVVIAYARSKVGSQYDKDGALGGGARDNPALCVGVLGSTMGGGFAGGMMAAQACGAAADGKWQDPNKYYCSELVLEAFERAGLHLAAGSPSVSVPQQIVDAYDQGVLEYVGHLR